MSLKLARGLLLTACLASGLGGCASDRDASAPDAALEPTFDARVLEPAEGDWFVCANAACSELQPTGLRLSADRNISHLSAALPEGAASVHFKDGDPYCVTEPFGTYEHHGSVLTLTLHDGGLVVDTDLVIDDSGVVAHGGEMHKVMGNATGRWVDKQCRLP